MPNPPEQLDPPGVIDDDPEPIRPNTRKVDPDARPNKQATR